MRPVSAVCFFFLPSDTGQDSAECVLNSTWYFFLGGTKHVFEHSYVLPCRRAPPYACFSLLSEAVEWEDQNKLLRGMSRELG